jgi:hypothetical protein
MESAYVAYFATADWKLGEVGKYATFREASDALVMHKYKPARGVIEYGKAGIGAFAVSPGSSAALPVAELEARVRAAVPARPWAQRLLQL